MAGLGRKPPAGIVRGAARLNSYGKQAAKQPGYLGSMARGKAPTTKQGGRVGLKPKKR
jgi:hypothetical protein